MKLTKAEQIEDVREDLANAKEALDNAERDQVEGAKWVEKMKTNVSDLESRLDVLLNGEEKLENSDSMN